MKNKMTQLFDDHQGAFASTLHNDHPHDDYDIDHDNDIYVGDDDDGDEFDVLTTIEENDDDIAIHMTDNMTYAADAFIASEMAKLSVEEQEKVYFDMHGISNYYDDHQETPDFIASSLSKLQDALQERLNQEDKPSSQCKAYQMALSQDATFVQDADFQLQFLRCDRFDPSRAALRIVRHFQLKLELFGANKLCKHITQDEDLDQDDTTALYNGFKQVLPLRDNAGRVVFLDMIQLTDKEDKISLEARLRRKFYSSMVACEEVETQRKGCILVAYAVDYVQVRYEFQYVSKVIQLLDAVPLRFETSHFCHNSNWTWGPKIALFRLAANIDAALRVQVHYGSHSECLFRLQTFGIPTSVMPLSPEGIATWEQNAKLWERRREYERQQRRCPLNTTANGSSGSGSTTTTSITTNSNGTSTHNNNNNNHNNNHKEEEDDQQRRQQQEPRSISPDPTTTTTATTTTADAPPAAKIILLPSKFDVLLGRGKGFQSHVGNIRFRHLVQELKEQYDDSTRNGKKEMTMEIVQQIKSSSSSSGGDAKKHNYFGGGGGGGDGGRFLKQTSTGWIEIDDEEARLKVSHTFRNLKIVQKKQQNSKKKKKKAKKQTVANNIDNVGLPALNDEEEESNIISTSKNKSTFNAYGATTTTTECQDDEQQQQSSSKKIRSETFGREFYVTTHTFE